uniref:WD-40 repeat protein n=2 Tax=Nonomuraea gerenzanensis TaxID=93944 RepID=A0A1M4BL07_9ACTN|nr:WD-40 repeat protein [Nonomuraea gerenzanensis]
MGRPDNPILNSGPTPELVQRLRTLRHNAGLTLRALKERTGYSIGTLSSALAGEKLPSWSIVSAIVQACGGKPEDVEQQWVAAAAHEALKARPKRDAQAEPGDQHLRLTALFGPAPIPVNAETVEEFMRDIRRVKVWAQDPSVRVLAVKLDVPPSTLQDFLSNKNGTMPSWDMVLNFLRACGVDQDAYGEWGFVWRRLKHQETERRLQQQRAKRPMRVIRGSQQA